MRKWFRDNQLLLLILLLALLLRVPTILWGNAALTKHEKIYHSDEPKIIKAAYKFPPQLSYLPHPTLYHYFLGIASVPLKMIIPVHDTRSFILLFFLINLYARLITIIFALASVMMTFYLGRKLYDKNHGLLAALFVSVSMAHAMSSSLALTYVPLSFFILLGAYKLIDINDTQDIKTFTQLGIISGLIISTKYVGVFFLVPLLAYSIFAWHQNKKKVVILRNLFFLPGNCFCDFISFYPYLIFREGKARDFQ